MLGQVPPNYLEARYWKITGSFWTFLALNVIALIGLVLFGAFFTWFAARVGRLQQVALSGSWLLGLLAGAILTLGLHELAHGLTMQLFGARPRYGIQWRTLLAYTTAPGHAFTRNQYLAVSLAPLISLSALAMLGMVLLAGTTGVWLLALCATLNAAGACGDLWMSTIVGRCPAAAYVVDERDGMRIFLPTRASK